MSKIRWECVNCNTKVRCCYQRKCYKCRIQGCKHCIIDDGKLWLCKVCSPPLQPETPKEIVEEVTEYDFINWQERKFWRMELKRDVWRRDRGCVYCGKRLPFRKATVDHLIPQTKGGENTLDNLVVACQTCNEEKKDLLPLNFIITRK